VGAKVYLRGKDATPTASEADQLHIYITANSQAVLDRAKKLANDLIASVQKQYEDFKQKKAAAFLYPVPPSYPVPYMPPYPYSSYPPFGSFPPYSPGRPPYSYHPRGPGGYPLSGFPPQSEAGSTPHSTGYPNYHYAQDPSSVTNHSLNPPDMSKEETTSSLATPSKIEGKSEQSSESYVDPSMNYYGYGYSQTSGYESSYSYPNYNYYPGMETSGVDSSKATTVPGAIDQGYHYNYTPYEDSQQQQQQQQYNYDTSQSTYNKNSSKK